MRLLLVGMFFFGKRYCTAVFCKNLGFWFFLGCCFWKLEETFGVSGVSKKRCLGFARHDAATSALQGVLVVTEFRCVVCNLCIVCVWVMVSLHFVCIIPLLYASFRAKGEESQSGFFLVLFYWKLKETFRVSGVS